MQDAGAEHIFDFVDAGLPSTVVPEGEYRRALRNLLSQMAAVEADVLVAEAHLTTGEPDAAVIALGEDLGVDMIVAGSRGLGSLRRPIGSVSSSIAAHAHCPVLVVRGE